MSIERRSSKKETKKETETQKSKSDFAEQLRDNISNISTNANLVLWTPSWLVCGQDNSERKSQGMGNEAHCTACFRVCPPLYVRIKGVNQLAKTQKCNATMHQICSICVYPCLACKSGRIFCAQHYYEHLSECPDKS